MSPLALQSDFQQVWLKSSVFMRLSKVESRLSRRSDLTSNPGHPCLAPASTKLRRCPCCADKPECMGIVAGGCRCRTCDRNMGCTCVKESPKGISKVGWRNGKLYRYLDLDAPYWATGKPAYVEGDVSKTEGVEITSGIDTSGNPWVKGGQVDGGHAARPLRSHHNESDFWVSVEEHRRRAELGECMECHYFESEEEASVGFHHGESDEWAFMDQRMGFLTWDATAFQPPIEQLQGLEISDVVSECSDGSESMDTSFSVSDMSDDENVAHFGEAYRRALVDPEFFNAFVWGFYGYSLMEGWPLDLAQYWAMEFLKTCR